MVGFSLLCERNCHLKYLLQKLYRSYLRVFFYAWLKFGVTVLAKLCFRCNRRHLLAFYLMEFEYFIFGFDGRMSRAEAIFNYSVGVCGLFSGHQRKYSRKIIRTGTLMSDNETLSLNPLMVLGTIWPIL